MGRSHRRGLLLSRAVCAGVAVTNVNAAAPEAPVWQDGKLWYVEYGGPGVKISDCKRIASYGQKEHCPANGMTFGEDGAKLLGITGAVDPFNPPLSGAVYRWTP